ncbi:MAG: HD domain-containing protein [Lachnospiraceae bacterium]|nr:HD domain-containing protein [Lachnospiraceae bacterium]
MNEADRLEKQMNFCRELDTEKFIKRMTYLHDGIRRENDAEHAWHMAVMAIVLSEYSNEPIDLLKTLKMILMHDVVEIDAGDTYAYDEKGKETQAEREKAAAERLYGLLPDKQGDEYRSLFEEFEAGETAEARFARTMDNMQPLMLQGMTNGKAWEENGVKLSQVLKRNERSKLGAEKLWEYTYENIIKKGVANGKLIDDVNDRFN